MKTRNLKSLMLIFSVLFLTSCNYMFDSRYMLTKRGKAVFDKWYFAMDKVMNNNVQWAVGVNEYVKAVGENDKLQVLNDYFSKYTLQVLDTNIYGVYKNSDLYALVVSDAQPLDSLGATWQVISEVSKGFDYNAVPMKKTVIWNSWTNVRYPKVNIPDNLLCVITCNAENTWTIESDMGGIANCYLNLTMEKVDSVVLNYLKTSFWQFSGTGCYMCNVSDSDTKPYAYIRFGISQPIYPAMSMENGSVDMLVLNASDTTETFTVKADFVDHKKVNITYQNTTEEWSIY